MNTFKDHFDVISAVFEVKASWIKGDALRDAQISVNTIKEGLPEPDNWVEEITINLNLRPDDLIADAIEALKPLERKSFTEILRKPDMHEDDNYDTFNVEGVVRIYRFEEAAVQVRVYLEYDYMKTPFN